MSDSGDTTLHPPLQPRRSITEYVGILDDPEIDIQALREEWAERTAALDNQA